MPSICFNGGSKQKGPFALLLDQNLCRGARIGGLSQNATEQA